MKSPATFCSTPFAPTASASATATDPTSLHSPARSEAPQPPLTPYDFVLAESLLYYVRERGFSFSAAAAHVGISFPSLCRWRLQNGEFALLLLTARTKYRTDRLGIIQEAKVKDGRPDWRAAAWELEHAHPEDYSLDPTRRAAFEASRQAELRAWEQAQADYAAEPAAAAAALQKSQSPPSRIVVHQGGYSHTVVSEGELQKFQNSLIGAGLTPPNEAAPIQTQVAPYALSDLSPTAPSNSPTPSQKFQNSPVPASAPAVPSDLSPKAPPSPAGQKLQNPPTPGSTSPAEKFQNPPFPGAPASTELPEELRARYEQEIRDIEQAHADHLAANSMYLP